MNRICAHWEKRNTGLNTVEYVLNERDGLDCINEICKKDTDIEYILVKVPRRLIGHVHSLERNGFRFLETQFHLEYAFSTELQIPACYRRICKAVSYEEIRSTDELKELLLNIDDDMFTNDRMSLDPSIGKGVSTRRYRNWIAGEMQTGSSRYFSLINKGKTVGFFLLRKGNSEGYYSALLAGVYTAFKGSGLGVSAVEKSIRWGYANNQKRLATRVSSNNIESYRIHMNLGYKLVNTSYVLRKMKRRAFAREIPVQIRLLRPMKNHFASEKNDHYDALKHDRPAKPRVIQKSPLKINPVKWDTEFFGFAVGKLEIDSAIVVSELKEALERSCFRAVYIQITNPTKDEIEQIGRVATPVDEKVIFQKKVGNVPLSVLEGLKKYKGNVTSELIELAWTSGTFSRFNTDANFRPHFKRLYRCWLERCILGDLADAVFVAYDGALPVGFVTLASKDKMIAEIGLIAVSRHYRRRGIASLLLRNSEAWCDENHNTFLHVATQEKNRPACRLYEKCGYEPRMKYGIFHYWRMSQ